LAQVLDCQRLAGVMLESAAFDFSGRFSEALTGGAKCSLTLQSLELLGDFGFGDSISPGSHFDSCPDHDSLVAMAAFSFSDHEAGCSLALIHMELSKDKFGNFGRPPDVSADGALKDISALSGRPPDWIVKCQSGFNGSLQHDSLRSPIPVAFGLGEALTVGAKCSVMTSCGDFGRLPESMIKMSYWLNRDLSMQYHDSWKKMFAFSFGDGEALTVGHCGRPPDYSFNELQHHDSLKIPVAFGLGEASSGGANCSLASLHLKLLRASLGDFGRPPEYHIVFNQDLSTQDFSDGEALTGGAKCSWMASRSLVLFGTMFTVSCAGLESTCFSWASIGKMTPGCVWI
jgi:hypothetical protein